MRPLVLTVQAFGPYAGKQTFDFQELGEGKVLFLITGPTGSGKSTILDALCFALYGDSSGGEREGKTFRSQFAIPSLETMVSLLFRVGDTSYLIERSPKQEAPKKRGDGVTEVAPTQTLSRVSKEDASLSVLSTRSNEIQSYIQSILGFSVDEFRQVVALPQGQFRRFLSSNVEERKSILNVLFQTHRYKDIEDSLKASLRGVESDYEQRKQAIVHKLEAIECDSIEALETQMKERAILKARLEKEKVQFSRKKAALQKELRLEESLDKAYRELDVSKEEFETLNKKHREQESLKKCLLRAEKAIPVLQSYDKVEAAKKAVKRYAGDFHECEIAITSLSKSVKESVKKLEAEQLHVPERKKLEAEIVRLGVKVKVLKERGESVADLKSLVSRMQEATERLSKSKNKQDTERESISLLEAKFLALKQEIGKEPDFEGQEQQLKKQRQSIEAQEGIKKRIIEAELLVQGYREERRLGEEQLTALQKHVEEAEGAWQQSQASSLASRLEKDSPCPVCGSLHHPNPAIPGNEHTTTEMLAKARAIRDKALAEGVKQKEKLSEADATLSSLRATYEANEKQLEGLSNEMVTAREVELAEQKKQAVTKKEEFAQTEKNLKEKRDSVKEQELLIERYQKDVQKMLEERAALQATIDLYEKELGDKELTEKLVQERLETCRQKLERYEKDFHNAEKELKERGDALTREQSKLAVIRSEKKRAEEEKLISLDAFREALIKAGFSDEADFLAARHSEDERTELRRRIDSFDRDFNRVQKRIEALTAEIAKRERPDLSVTSSKLETVEEEYQQCSNELTRVLTEDERDVQVFDQLTSLQKNMTQDQRKYEILEPLSHAASGKNERRMGFETYVLSFLFQDVLIAANQRLSAMTNRRYTLCHKENVVDRRSQAGLDIEVYDDYTGQKRPAHTLSGGEGFMASLSLALGLSDVVQAYAGGIELETLFIDEGFGSLDPDSLDLALRTLSDLQKGGRLIGIISHVSELKERLDVRLEVSAGVKGSTARFVTPG